MAQVTGTPNADKIEVGTASVGVEPTTGATSENDTIIGLAEADSLAGGAGSDDFQFDPSNRLEGHDVIQDFTLQSLTDSAKLDYVAFKSAELLAADRGLPGADGNATSLSLGDFDASPNWNLSSSARESLLVVHPGGSIEFAGIPSNTITSFNDLAPFLKVDGQVWSGPISLTPAPPDPSRSDPAPPDPSRSDPAPPDPSRSDPAPPDPAPSFDPDRSYSVAAAVTSGIPEETREEFGIPLGEEETREAAPPPPPEPDNSLAPADFDMLM